jgi:hypothetical protein
MKTAVEAVSVGKGRAYNRRFLQVTGLCTDIRRLPLMIP